MNPNEIFETLKKYVNGEIKAHTLYGKKCEESVSQVIDRCYGAVMFSSYFVAADKKELYNWDEKVGNWWDDEILPKLRTLE